jgi:hypothetical protein
MAVYELEGLGIRKHSNEAYLIKHQTISQRQNTDIVKILVSKHKKDVCDLGIPAHFIRSYVPVFESVVG